MVDSSKAIIIGSGVAGIAAAIRLAVQGYEVSVFEKNSYPGGKLSLIETQGYRFDAGPSLFTDPENIEALFDLAGEPIEAYFNYRQVEAGCHYFWENGKTLITWSDKALLLKAFEEQLNEPAENILQYLRQAEKEYQHIGTVFLDHSLHKISTWTNKRILRALVSTKLHLLFQNLDQYNRKKLATPEAVQLFNRFATYNGSNPYRAPAMLSLIAHIELNKGVYYPQGGMISITNALYKLALKKGVQFFFNQPVQRIVHTSNTVKAVVVDDKNICADIVVSNADIYFTYKNLLGDDNKASKIGRTERSTSAIVFYWGIKKQFPQLGLHNILFSNSYKTEFDHLSRQKDIYTDPTIYINITSKMESGQAPEGKENWFVMINAPANTGQNWKHLKDAARKAIVQKLNNVLKEDIEPYIEVEEILDPLTLETNTGAYMGALYGNSSNSRIAAFLRQPNFSSAIKGLYFCGGTVHPGGGIPLCLKSAKIVGGMIENLTMRFVSDK